MNNNYDNEATQYEETVVNNPEETTQKTENAAENSNNQQQPVDEKNSKGTWKSAAASAVTGAAVGAGAAVLMGMTPIDPDDPNEQDPQKDEEPKPKDDVDVHNLVDEDVPIATTVNDDMKFGEAFAAARAELGPGGVFEWNGRIYSTYYAEEWDAMTPEQQAEFNSNFAWNKHDSSAAGNEQEAAAQTATDQTTTNQDTVEQNDVVQTNDDDIEIVSVEQGNTTEQNLTEVSYEHSGSDIEVLGVVHDAESGANIAGVSVEGQEVLLVDVDNDIEQTFDVMVMDADGNGEITDNEIVDIHNDGLTVDDLGGYTDPSANLLVENDTPDYVNDAAVYDA